MTENLPASKKKQTENNENVPIFCSERWRLAYLSFVGFIFISAVRVNISVAIVCMVKPDNTTDNSTESVKCGASVSSDSDSDQGEFDWDKTTQSTMLSAFFYGYIVMNIPAGWLADTFGGKKVLGIGLTIVSIATVLLPVLARQDYRFVYGLRVITGLASAVAYPGMHAVLGRWAPPAERSRLTSFVYTGFNVGNILTFTLSGYLCVYGFDHGWGSVFYLSGGAFFLWLAAWWLLVSDSPHTSSRISEAERNYIINGIGNNPHKTVRVPWLAMAKSRALWVCLTAHFCNNYMNYTLLTSLPTFMKEVLRYDIKQNGILSSVPYLAMVLSAVVGGQVADFLRARYLTTRTTRRGFQAVSFLGSGACLVGTGYVDCENRTIAVALLSVAVAFQGLNYSGFMVNHIDFAPRFAGVLFGITNCISTIPGIVAPQVAGLLTPNKTQAEWRTVFYVVAGFTLFGAIVFGGFAVTDTEPWAKDPDDPVDDVRNMEVVVDSKPHGNGNLAYDNDGLDTDDVTVTKL